MEQSPSFLQSDWEPDTATQSCSNALLPYACLYSRYASLAFLAFHKTINYASIYISDILVIIRESLGRGCLCSFRRLGCRSLLLGGAFRRLLDYFLHIL